MVATTSSAVQVRPTHVSGLPGELVDDVAQLQSPVLGGFVELEVEDTVRVTWYAGYASSPCRSAGHDHAYTLQIPFEPADDRARSEL